MAPITASLVSTFHEAQRSNHDPRSSDEGLEAALADFIERGRAAWPGVPLEAEALVAYLGERAPADTAPAPWLAELRAGDLFLACACACGVPEALRAFDGAFLQHLGDHLRSLRATPELVAETKQELLEKLFVGTRAGPPKIRQYEGRGALGGWVRVAAVRVALNILEAEKADRPRSDDAEELAHAMVPEGDPELDLLRAACQRDFLAAFREAVASLSRRDRALLRFTFIERLTPARVGAMYGVHRTTAMRWIEAAQEEVLAGTRARLQLSPSECDRLFSLVRSRLDVSLGALLQTAP